MLTLKKNYASLESKADNLYELTEEDIKRMHEVLLEMYDDLFEVCEKNSIKMLASGGTALGTIRHQGFIPWDDDMDLHFSRSDYETFIKIFEKELGEKYGVFFLPSDFKKKEGYKRSIDLSKQFELYRQNYCGCIYSKEP